jgi:hypothetical protein
MTTVNHVVVYHKHGGPTNPIIMFERGGINILEYCELSYHNPFMHYDIDRWYITMFDTSAPVDAIKHVLEVADIAPWYIHVYANDVLIWERRETPDEILGSKTTRPFRLRRKTGISSGHTHMSTAKNRHHTRTYTDANLAPYDKQYVTVRFNHIPDEILYAADFMTACFGCLRVCHVEGSERMIRENYIAFDTSLSPDELIVMCSNAKCHVICAIHNDTQVYHCACCVPEGEEDTYDYEEGENSGSED